MHDLFTCQNIQSDLEDRKKRTNYLSFVIDSGATIHCINDPSKFETIYENQEPVILTVANGKKVMAEMVGSVRLTLTDTKGQNHDFILHNVVYSKHFTCGGTIS